MGSFQLTVTSHRTKTKTLHTMSSTLISSLLLSNMAASTMASVAVGLGQIKQDTQLAYPYCCPRSFCPTKTTNFFEDIISNSIDMVLGGGDSDVEELQMAAASCARQPGRGE